MFERWKKRREEKKQEDLHRKGFDYAAGKLLRGCSPFELESEADRSRMSDNYDSFDLGIEDAVRAFNKLTGEED